MPPAHERPEVRLRLLVEHDAEWVVTTDRTAATALARPFGFDEQTLRSELAEGRWASDERFAWAVMVDGQPAGFALVDDLDRGDASVTLRIGPNARGRGVGREVLRQLADHHFSADDHLGRLTGRAHERNVPMQRVFNAAGFRMEARFRDSVEQPEGGRASEWGYALTRADWEAGRHRHNHHGYDLHGLTFEVEQTSDGPDAPGLAVKFLQEGRRTLARYDADHLAEGELAGILVGDLLRYRFVHLEEVDTGAHEVVGRGRARLQRRDDGRLEVIEQWSDEEGNHGRRVLVQRVR
ncbi:MAG: GNAT family N-acetyltransferase [Nitriliruptoraceae bacterium]|nr:GNAT family N-acetyltransferase [Nitriliruptoraceae bacterium]